MLFALTYNGHSECSPEEPEDAGVLELFNTHQRQNDKGFGAAAGPDAVARTIAAFTESGYNVRSETTNWMLTPEMKALQQQLIDGWADASSEIAPAKFQSVFVLMAANSTTLPAGDNAKLVNSAFPTISSVAVPE